jgi:hypothetical protein
MKKVILSLLVVAACVLNTTAQSLKTPAPSPSQTIKQDFALSNIEVAYSRPSVKGRTVFGDVVPFGKVWRTGANSATTITFGDTVMIGGKKVSPGKYGLLTIPNAAEWTIIISTNTTVTSPADYKQEEDVVRATAKTSAMVNPVESFTLSFANMKPTSCELQFLWDKTLVAMPISAEIDARIMKDIDKLVMKDNRPYYSAAMYYMDNGKDLNKALEWFSKAEEANPKAYWVVHQKANCLAKLGRKKEAIDSANKSIELAKADEDDNYVKLNEKLILTLK